MLLEYHYLYLQYYISYVLQIQTKVFIFQLPKLAYLYRRKINSF